MQRREFLKHWLGRFSVALLLVGIVIYTVFHVFAGSSSSLLTTPVKGITDTQILEGTAYLFRDETVLSSTSLGVIDAVAESGSKVAQGVELARVYPASEENATDLQASVDRLNRLHELLEASRPARGETLSVAASYRKAADAAFLELCRAVRTGDLSVTVGMEREMLTLLNRYNALISSSLSLTEAIATVEAEKNALLSGASTSVMNLQRSGYFYDRTAVDGYETLFTASAAENLTAARFSELVRSEPVVSSGQYPVGKMAYAYEWYLAVSFSGAPDLFEVERGYDVRFPDNGGRTLNLVCERLLTAEDGTLIVLFRSDVTPSEFSYLRRQSVEITARTTEGLYVPTKALWTVEGVRGVYVFEESTVYFRRVEVLIEGDGYLIVANLPDQAGYLALNDILILSGGKLYDGKVYR